MKNSGSDRKWENSSIFFHIGITTLLDNYIKNLQGVIELTEFRGKAIGSTILQF